LAARSQLAVRHPHSLFHSTVLLFVRRPCPRELGRRFCLVVWALWLGCFGCSDESGLNTARIIFRPSHHSDRKERQMIFGSRKANFGCSFSPFIELSDRLCYHDFYFHGLNWNFFPFVFRVGIAFALLPLLPSFHTTSSFPTCFHSLIIPKPGAPRYPRYRL